MDGRMNVWMNGLMDGRKGGRESREVEEGREVSMEEGGRVKCEGGGGEEGRWSEGRGEGRKEGETAIKLNVMG